MSWIYHGYTVQAVCNKLNIFPVLEILLNLNRLKRVLISRRILFKKINVMPKGRFPKLKGSICNISTDSNNIANVLPQGADSNGLLVVKLKRKLNYCGHVYFEVVHSKIIYQALMYLKQSNSLYHDIGLALNNIPRNLLLLTDNTND